jgi:hypothetical protein
MNDVSLDGAMATALNVARALRYARPSLGVSMQDISHSIIKNAAIDAAALQLGFALALTPEQFVHFMNLTR